MQPASQERSQAKVPTLRPARDSDLDFMLDLCRKVFLEFGSYDRYMADWFREEIVSSGIADLDSAPAGFFMLAIHPEQPTQEAVAEGNARAQRMFARRGFRIGHVIGVYPAGQRAVFMTKALKKGGKS